MDGVLPLTAAEIAAADQADAHERELALRVQRVAAWFLVLSTVLGSYALLAAYGVLPASPWSALGQAQQAPDELPAPPPPVFEIPDGYAPAVPLPPGATLSAPDASV